MRPSIPPTAAALLALAAALCATLNPFLTAASELDDTINVLDKRLPYAGEACCATVGCDDILCHPTQYEPSSLELNGTL